MAPRGGYVPNFRIGARAGTGRRCECAAAGSTVLRRARHWFVVRQARAIIAQSLTGSTCASLDKRSRGVAPHNHPADHSRAQHTHRRSGSVARSSLRHARRRRGIFQCPQVDQRGRSSLDLNLIFHSRFWEHTNRRSTRAGGLGLNVPDGRRLLMPMAAVTVKAPAGPVTAGRKNGFPPLN